MYKLLNTYLNKTTYPLVKLILIITTITLFLSMYFIDTTYDEIYPLTKIVIVLFNFNFIFSLYTSKMYEFERFFLNKRKQIAITYLLIILKEITEITIIYYGLTYIIFSNKYYIPIDLLLEVFTEELILFSVVSITYVLLENTMYIFIIPIFNFVLWFLQDVLANNTLTFFFIKYNYNKGEPNIIFNPYITYPLAIILYTLFLVTMLYKRRK